MARLRQLGEEDFRIFDVGAPQLDDMVGRDFQCDTVRIGKTDYDLRDPYILVLQHPVMSERDQAHEQIEETIQGCLSTKKRVFWIYPNSDLGYKAIIDSIQSRKNLSNLVSIPNVERSTFLKLLQSYCLVGNRRAV